MRLVAAQEFTYGGKKLKVGDPFESVSDQDAKMLKGWGKAKDAEKKFTIKNRAMKSNDDESEHTELPAEPIPHGHYRRADMRSVD